MSPNTSQEKRIVFEKQMDHRNEIFNRLRRDRFRVKEKELLC